MNHSVGSMFTEGEIMANEAIYSNFDFVDAGTNSYGDEDDAVKCGDVFLVRNEYFVLICGLCNAAYDDLNEFGEHMLGEHLNCCEEDDCTVKDYTPILRKIKFDSNEYMVEGEVSAIYEIDGAHTSTTHRQPEIQVCNPKLPERVDWTESPNTHSQNRNSDAPASVEQITRIPRGQPVLYDPSLHCKQCDRQYPRKSLLDAHNEYKHNKPRPCEFCFKTFTNTSDLNEHRTTHTDERSYQCPKCPKTFTTKHYRNEHISAVHEGIKKFKCPHCPMSFSQTPRLTVHLLQHSVPGDYSCEVCGRQFVYKSRKIAHMRMHTGEKPYQCEICGKDYSLQSRLTEHMKRHFDRKEHECKDCGKRFYTKVMLKYHAVIHSNEKPFKCADCGRGFSRFKALKTHQLIHAPVKKYACHICDKKFAQGPGLISHMKSHRTKEK